MRVLIIARSFAPDSGIATVRPTKMAKYLSKMGHNVFVIRSGNITGKGDLKNLDGLEKVRIYSYEGVDSDAERLERGECLNSPKEKKTTIKDIPVKRLGPIRRIIRFFYDPFIYYNNDGSRIKSKIIKIYDTNTEIRNIDIIISTFSPLGTIQAANIIKERENCRWIIDFRDLMDNITFSPLLRKINARLQDYYCRQCDACLCVSEGTSERLKKRSMKRRKENVYTVYNGYDQQDSTDLILDKEGNTDPKLHICYTGTMHMGHSDSLPLFKSIMDCGLQNDIVIDYAGKDGNEIKRQANTFGLESIVKDHGYLSRYDTAKLQVQSDLFLVISWNTKNDQGIMTGKFYEALQHKKPIIAIVSGDIPNSELAVLIKRYNLGCCYEEAEELDSYRNMKSYLCTQCNLKKQRQHLKYEPDVTVYEKFEYGNIVKELERILLSTNG